MKLRRDEEDLTGKWIHVGSKIESDDVCRRIEFLVEHSLEKVAESPEYGAWEILYRDPADGRLWERTFPRGDMSGGGPPRLAVIPEDVAKAKYKFE